MNTTIGNTIKRGQPSYNYYNNLSHSDKYGNKHFLACAMSHMYMYIVHVYCAAQAGGPGFDPQWLPRIFSLSAGLY